MHVAIPIIYSYDLNKKYHHYLILSAPSIPAKGVEVRTGVEVRELARRRAGEGRIWIMWTENVRWRTLKFPTKKYCYTRRQIRCTDMSHYPPPPHTHCNFIVLKPLTSWILVEYLFQIFMWCRNLNSFHLHNEITKIIQSWTICWYLRKQYNDLDVFAQVTFSFCQPTTTVRRPSSTATGVSPTRRTDLSSLLTST